MIFCLFSNLPAKNSGPILKHKYFAAGPPNYLIMMTITTIITMRTIQLILGLGMMTMWMTLMTLMTLMTILVRILH